jgi:hypothetical protein
MIHLMFKKITIIWILYFHIGGFFGLEIYHKLFYSSNVSAISADETAIRIHSFSTVRSVLTSG